MSNKLFKTDGPVNKRISDEINRRRNAFVSVVKNNRARFIFIAIVVGFIVSAITFSMF